MNQSYIKSVEFAPLLARYMEKCDSPSDVTLPTYLCLAFLSERVKKRFFGGEYVTIGDQFDVFGQVCEFGALVGSRSDGDFDKLEILASTKFRNRNSVNWVLDVRTIEGSEDVSQDWEFIVQGLDEGLTIFEQVFGTPPQSLIQYTKGMAYLMVDRSYAFDRDRERLDKQLDRRVGLDDSTVKWMLTAAVDHFNFGIAFALTYPDRLAEMSEMWDAVHVHDSESIDQSEMPSIAEINENRLGFCLGWAQRCRPDLLHLFEDASASPKGTVPTQPEEQGNADLTTVEKRFATAQSNTNSDLGDEYVRMGLPISMAVHLEGFASAQPSSGLSLPLFLTLAYVSDHFTSDSSGKSVVNIGTLMASHGAVCEVGGVIGRTTDIEPLELLPRVLGKSSLTPSVEEHWRDATLRAERTLESFIATTGTDPTGLLPLYIATSYFALDIDYPNDVDTIKRDHELQMPFWEHRESIVPAVIGAFTTGIALVRNHPDTFAGKHGVYVDEAPDPITKTYKNPQSETNLRVGSTYSREEQLHLCRVWADLYRPEAKPLFEGAS